MIGGKWFAVSFGAGLAGDPIGRQEPISAVRKSFESYYGKKPALVVVAVHDGREDDVARAIRALLDKEPADDRAVRASLDGATVPGAFEGHPPAIGIPASYGGSD